MNLQSKVDVLRGLSNEGMTNLTLAAAEDQTLAEGTIVALVSRQLDPVKVLKMVDDSLTSAPTLGTSDRGKAYVVGGTGGGWAGFAVGDIVEWDGTNWNLIVQNNTGVPPAGTRIIVVGENAAGSFATRENQIAVYQSGAWVFTQPVNKNHVKIDGQSSVFYGFYYDYKGTYPDGFWYKPLLQKNAPAVATPAAYTLSHYFWGIVIRGQNNFDSAFLGKAAVLPLHAGLIVRVPCTSASSLVAGNLVAVAANGIIEPAGANKRTVGVVIRSNGKSGSEGEIVFATL